MHKSIMENIFKYGFNIISQFLSKVYGSLRVLVMIYLQVHNIIFTLF